MQKKGCQLCNNYDSPIITEPITLKLRMHVGILSAIYCHVSQQGCDCTCARARQRSFQISRTAGPIASNLVYLWGPVSRVACKSILGPTLHVRPCSVTIPDLKNGWTDCVQIWCTETDQLAGCSESPLEAPPRSSARAGLNLSLARLLPPKRRLTGYERASEAKTFQYDGKNSV